MDLADLVHARMIRALRPTKIAPVGRNALVPNCCTGPILQ